MRGGLLGSVAAIEVVEDVADDDGVFDGGDDSILRSVNGTSLCHYSILRSVNGTSLCHYSDLATAVLAGFNVDVEHALETLRPGHAACRSVGVRVSEAVETIIGLYKTEVIHRRGPWRHLQAVEYATLEWVDWFNHRRLLEPIGNVPPAELEASYYHSTGQLPMAA
jgi:hypothetical protein